MIRSCSFNLPRFDPLELYLHHCPNGPGFLETLNPRPKTGRYSIVPLSWQERYQLRDGQLLRSKGDRSDSLPGDPFANLAAILAERSLPIECESPFPGGFFGYFSYDLAASIEDLPRQAIRDLPTPDLDLYWVDATAVYDHRSARLILAALPGGPELPELKEQIQNFSGNPPVGSFSVTQQPQPILSQEQFMAMVERGKEYILNGDIYQVNLSCRFDGTIEGDSTELYRQLRELNPSPFACYLNFPGLEIISSSPERLVSLSNGLAEARPIAGTRPRGFTLPEDDQLRQELLGHPKERAEHRMLIDLARNDLGKVCQFGSVEVDELMVLEPYSHVTHIVSNVSGRLTPKNGPFDLLKATFPGGTITGVPKKRCMEIIDELEPVGRGSYTGSAGFISVTGDMDLNILIRSFQRFGNQLNYQTGAGIVADSIPAREWHECLAKGEALRTVLKQKKD